MFNLINFQNVTVATGTDCNLKYDWLIQNKSQT